MARGRRSSRSRGGRGRRGEEAAPPTANLVGTQEMVPLDFTEADRPSRATRGRATSSGGGGSGIGVVIPLVITVVAAVALLIGGFLVASGGKSGMNKVMDQVGAQTALALSVVEPDWWELQHGMGNNLYAFWKKHLQPKLAAAQREGEVDFEALKIDIGKAEVQWDIKELSRDKDFDRLTADANQKRLDRLVESSGSQILYAAILRADGNTAFRFSKGQPTLAFGSARAPVGSVTVMPVMATLSTGRRVEGRLYECPVTDRAGQAAGKIRLVLSAAALKNASGSGTMMILVSVLVGILLVGAISFVLCMGASKSIKTVTRDVEQIAGGNLDVRVKGGGGGEVGNLARAVDRAMKTFRAVQEQSFTAAAAQPVAAAAGASVDATDLLPAEPPRIDGYEIEAVHKPCPEGANDFFDYILVDDQHIGIVIADMPHPGPKGAFIASTFRALMRGYAPGEASPAVVLGRVNRVMASELKRGDHITAMYAVLDLSNSIVAVASAGHLPLIFWKLAKRGSALLNPEGIAIGLDKGPVFEKTVVDKRIKLEKGDRFVVHTDGPVAAKNMEGEEYGEQRFYYLVNREAPKNSAAFVNFVANEVDLYHEGAMQEDDITVVTLRKLSD